MIWLTTATLVKSTYVARAAPLTFNDLPLSKTLILGFAAASVGEFAMLLCFVRLIPSSAKRYVRTALVVSLAVMTFGLFQTRQKVAMQTADLQTLANAESSYLKENGRLAVSIDQLLQQPGMVVADSREPAGALAVQQLPDGTLRLRAGKRTLDLSPQASGTVS
jgi:hypothetical protein